MRRLIAGLLFVQVWFAASVQAQTTPQEDEGNSSRSITGRFLAGMRSPIGFSLGIFELYAPDLSGSAAADKSAIFTMMRPRLFANTKTKRSQLQLDYAFGYKRHNHRPEIRSSDHSATLDFQYRLSNSASLQISDTFRSAFNDYGALPNSTTPTMYQPGFVQELYAPRARATTNTLVTGIGYRAGKRTNLNVFGSYDIWRYSNSTFGNAQGLQVGIRGDHQITKWLFLNSSYSHYLNEVDPRFEAASIHRLQVGGFKFKIGRSAEFYLSGGADYTRFQGVRYPTASYQAGLSKTAGSTLVSLVYHRGLSAAVGPQTTLNGHMVSASLTQWLGGRVNLRLDSGYTRGSSVNNTSRIEYLGGNGEVQITLQRHLLFSVQSSYVSQRGRNLPSENPILSRYTVSTGLQFFLSSLGGRQTSRR